MHRYLAYLQINIVNQIILNPSKIYMHYPSNKYLDNINRDLPVIYIRHSTVRVRSLGMEYSASHHPDAIDTNPHYIDVIMGAMTSQITSTTIAYSTVYSGVDQRKHQSSASLTFVNSSHKWPVMRKMFPFDDVIMRGCSGIIVTWFIAVAYQDERFRKGTEHKEMTDMNNEKLLVSQVLENLSSINGSFYFHPNFNKMIASKFTHAMTAVLSWYV